MRVRERVDALTGGASLVPLLLLFGLNAVDELDRAAFSVVGPEIRDAFDLSLTQFGLISIAVLPATLIVAVPLARFADRRRRTPIAIGGAAAWGVFALLTGFAPVFLILIACRLGAGLGRAVNGPTHPSLLSDYYPPTSRAKVLTAHRIANPVGQFFAPLAAGFIAAAFHWRIPFFILAIPTFVLVVFAARYLREPERTGQRIDEGDVKLRRATKTLWQIPTLRRLCFAFPFLAIVAIGLGQLMQFYYADVFDVKVQHRGIISAFDAPFSVIGLGIGSVLIDRGMLKDPGRTLRVIGFCAASISLLIFGVGVAPVLWMGVLFNYGVNILAPILLTGGIVIVSLISPPESRSSAFAIFEVFSLAGIIGIPIATILGDAYGIRTGIMAIAPVLLIGSAIVVSAGRFVNADLARIYPDYGSGADGPPSPPQPDDVPPPHSLDSPTTPG